MGTNQTKSITNAMKNEDEIDVSIDIHKMDKNAQILDILKIKYLFRYGFYDTLPKIPVEVVNIILRKAQRFLKITTYPEEDVAEVDRVPNANLKYLTMGIPSNLPEHSKLEKIEIFLVKNI